MTAIDTPSLLNMRQAADRLGISVETAYRLARRRILPSIRVGGSVRVDPRDLDDYVNRQKVNP